MQIAIVDDDPQAAEYLRTCLETALQDACIRAFAGGEELLAEWSAGRFDLVILDIFMGGMTGMEVAHRLRETDSGVRIVFCTTSNEFASESYEVNARYYLHKPFGEEQVRAMLDRLNLAELDLLRTLQLPDGSNLRLRSILYVDFSAHCVTLHCKNGETRTLRIPFSEMEARLRDYPYFYCPGKGVLVNFYEVEAQEGDTFRMSDGSLLPISRRKAKEVLDAYSSFRFQLLRKGGGR